MLSGVTLRKATFLLDNRTLYKAITKTTDESQTSTDELHTTTDESQTTTDESQMSHRRVSDDYR